MRILLVGCLLCGCIADIRPAIQAVDSHIREIITVNRAETLPSAERRELVEFHAVRAGGWTEAMLRHKGHPALPVPIARTPADTRSVRQEDIRLEQYEADIETERQFREGIKGLLAGGGLSVATLMGLAKLLLDRKKDRQAIQHKDKAIVEYDSAIDRLPKDQRISIATGPYLQDEHARLRAQAKQAESARITRFL